MEQYENKSIRIINQDCLEFLNTLDDKSIDLVVTDPPYRITSHGSAGENAPRGILGNRSNIYCKSRKLFKFNDIEFSQWIPEVYRVLKENSHCYIMSNTKNLFDIYSCAVKTGFNFQNLLVWKKNNATPNKYYMQQCEYILMLRRGGAKTINNPGETNIFEIKNPSDKFHPTEKPVELMDVFVQNSSNENDIVLDPFMGSGSTAISCLKNNRKFIGCEIDPEYFVVAKNRIEEYNKIGYHIDIRNNKEEVLNDIISYSPKISFI